MYGFIVSPFFSLLLILNIYFSILVLKLVNLNLKSYYEILGRLQNFHTQLQFQFFFKHLTKIGGSLIPIFFKYPPTTDLNLPLFN